jgi:hypothetical protein
MKHFFPSLPAPVAAAFRVLAPALARAQQALTLDQAKARPAFSSDFGGYTLGAGAFIPLRVLGREVIQ